MEKKKNYKIPLLIALLVMGASMLFTSCSDDDDDSDLLVGYYLHIDSQVSLSLYEHDETQGSSASPNEDVMSNTIVNMKNTLREVYPEATLQGDDAGVIMALDKIYRKYKSMYGHLERNTVCTVKLFRTKMDGTVVKKSRTLQVYQFGAIPQETDESVN